MKVLLELKETSEAIEHEAVNTYTKGPLFCVYEISGRVVKYPLSNVWRVVHDYSTARPS